MTGFIALAWAAIGGLRGIVVAAAVLGAAHFYNIWVDNPFVAHNAASAATAKIRAEMVSKAELAAAEAKAAGMKKIADKQTELATEAARRAADAEHANQQLLESINTYNTENANLQDQVNELLSKPVDTACTVDGALVGKLRGR